MKKIISSFVFIFLSIICFSQKVISKEKIITLKYTDFLINPTKHYDLSSTDDLKMFINKVILTNKDISSDTSFFPFIDANLEKVAIIFIRHSFDQNAYEPVSTVSEEIDALQRKDSTSRANSKKINTMLLNLRLSGELSPNEYNDAIELLKSPKNGNIDFLKNIAVEKRKDTAAKNILISSLIETKLKIDNSIPKTLQDIEDRQAGIIETESIIKDVLHTRNKIPSSYLLETKKILIIFLGGKNDLQKAEIDIKNSKNTLAQSLSDLIALFKTVAGGASPSIPCRLAIINANAIKPPSNIIVKNSALKDSISFIIHERNTASFQVGLSNNKFQLNNFAITNGNLVVKADTAQQKNWKSNLYATFELHFPRDIDNFTPIYKTIFKGTDSGRTFGRWLYDVTLSRIGIYGGFKISDDPLSNLYAGFNYAITKELYVNFGWTWSNDVVPQVTSIGSITSLSDATKYAKRKYSTPQFSWGLSFSPSAVMTLLGLGK